MVVVFAFVTYFDTLRAVRDGGVVVHRSVDVPLAVAGFAVHAFVFGMVSTISRALSRA